MFNKLSGKTDWDVWVCVWKVGAGAGNRAACTGTHPLHHQLPPLPWRTVARAAERADYIPVDGISGVETCLIHQDNNIRLLHS